MCGSHSLSIHSLLIYSLSPFLHTHAHCHTASDKLKAMEACFLLSNSFTKTPDQPLHALKSPSPSLRKRSSLQFHSRKVALPCCHLSSSSPLDAHDERPSLDADWRSFRARLVAGERLRTTSEEPSSSSVADPPPISVGDKWAHIIHEPEKGCLLIATEKLDGVHIFERTVVLLLSTGPIGPSGIILNRPSLMSIKETRSTAMDEEGMFSNRPLFFGGPLEAGVFLLGPKEECLGKGASGVLEEVMKGLYYGTRESVGCAAEMVKRNVVGVGDLRFFEGYCGWENEQLREEIRAGYWTVAACSPSVVGLRNVASIGLWEEVLGLMGRRKVW